MKRNQYIVRMVTVSVHGSILWRCDAMTRHIMDISFTFLSCLVLNALFRRNNLLLLLYFNATCFVLRFILLLFALSLPIVFESFFFGLADWLTLSLRVSSENYSFVCKPLFCIHQKVIRHWLCLNYFFVERKNYSKSENGDFQTKSFWYWVFICNSKQVKWIEKKIHDEFPKWE